MQQARTIYAVLETGPAKDHVYRVWSKYIQHFRKRCSTLFKDFLLQSMKQAMLNGVNTIDS